MFVALVKSRRRRSSVWLCALAALALGLGVFGSGFAQTPIADPPESRIYALSSADASSARAQLLEALRSVGAEVSVVADPQSSRLIVTATGSVHQLVDRLLGQIESSRFESSQHPTSAQGAGEGPLVRSYQIPPAQRAYVDQLANHLSATPGFRGVYDSRSGHWVVVAPADIHRQIAAQFTPMDLPAARPKAPAETTRPSTNQVPVVPLPPVAQPRTATGSASQTIGTSGVERQPTNNQTAIPPSKVKLQLCQLTARSLHARLEKVLERPLPTQRDRTEQWVRFVVDGGDGTPVEFVVHQQNGELLLKGRWRNVQSWKQIVAALDTPPTDKQVTQLVSTDPASEAKVRQVVGAINTSAAEGGNIPRLARLAQRVQNQGEDSAAPANRQADPLDSLLGPVQIESVEGTDVLVLRGNPRDVQRVMEVIEEIERLAAISEPRLEVVVLAHVQSEALARLLQQVFEQSLSNYGYGRLTVVPLVKPNAVLVVGLPTTVGKAVQILQRLDQPGEALTQFEVFRLKHATAANASTVVENMFDTQANQQVPTLAPKALIVADGRTNALIVRASPRDMQEVRALIEELDRPGNESVNELRIFKLKNTIATELEDVLQSALSEQGNQGADSESDRGLNSLLRLVTIGPAGQAQLESGVLADARITADTGTNALVVSAPTESMPLLEALIAQLDQTPDAAAELKVFTIVNGDAIALGDMLDEMFGSEQQQQGGGANQDQQRLFQLRFSVDERTNSIIAAGSSEELLVVEAVLLRLDGSDVRQRRSRIYRLKNAPAEAIAQALRETLTGERGVQETAPGVASPFQQIEREVVVVPDVNSNSLIISSTPQYYDRITELVDDLDVQAPMVMIQVLIAEIALGDADEFGVELGLQDSVMFDRSLLEDIDRTTVTAISQNQGTSDTVTTQIIDSARLTPGFDFGDPNLGLGNSGSNTSLATAAQLAAQGLSSFGVGRISQEAGFGGLVLSASSDSVSMLLRALQESQRVEVLSRPQIMALDNQTGRAFVGQTVPFITGTSIDQLGRTLNTIEPRDVGLNLEVTPRISPDGLVVMNVFASNDRLGPVSDGVPIAIANNGDPINSPIIDSISATTTVSAVSGQTIVLSGLLTKRDRALHRRVPLLADIPLVGSLFRFDSTSTLRTELLIVLTPHVINNQFEAEMIKQIESARMNWCLADVVDMHGPAGLRSQGDRLGAAEAETIYPNEMPSGEQLLLPPGSEMTQPQIAPPFSQFSPPTEQQNVTPATYNEPPKKRSRFNLLRNFGKSTETSDRDKG